VRRDGEGRPQVVVLRNTWEQVENPMGLLPNGQSRGMVWRSWGRLEVLDGAGKQVASHELSDQVSSMRDAQDGSGLLLITTNGTVHELAADGSLKMATNPGPGWVRAAVVTTDGPAFATDEARGLWAGRFGAGGSELLFARGRGGDLVGLTPEGEQAFRIELQRTPKKSAIADLNGDGQQELVIHAQWFGLAAIQAEYEGKSVAPAAMNPCAEADDDNEKSKPKKRAKRNKRKRK